MARSGGRSRSALRGDRPLPGPRLARFAGGAAVATSIVVSAVVVVSGEGVNPLSAVTLVGGALGGAGAIWLSDSAPWLALCGIVVAAAGVPALIGGVGVLYVVLGTVIIGAGLWRNRA